MSKEIPIIIPGKVKEYKTKQSKYEMVSPLPTRSILLAPSGSGKTVLLASMVTDIYRDCFARIFIFSPSIEIDGNWSGVKHYIKNNMKLEETEEEQFYFDKYDEEALEDIISTQHKIIKHMKKQNHEKLHQILIIIDDFADQREFVRSSTLLHKLFIRGRHSYISTLVATQQYYALAPIIRINASEMYVFRLRNAKDLESFIDEVSAVTDKKTLMDIYNLAVNDQPYSFLYIKLTAKTK
jgi:hypothetical protein